MDGMRSTMAARRKKAHGARRWRDPDPYAIAGPCCAFVSSFHRHQHPSRKSGLARSITTVMIITKLLPANPRHRIQYRQSRHCPEADDGVPRSPPHWGVPYPLPGADSLPLPLPLPFPFPPPPGPPPPLCGGPSKYCPPRGPPSSRGLGRYLGGENGFALELDMGADAGAPPARGGGYIPNGGYG